MMIPFWQVQWVSFSFVSLFSLFLNYYLLNVSYFIYLLIVGYFIYYYYFFLLSSVDRATSVWLIRILYSPCFGYRYHFRELKSYEIFF